jgi:hypothetical protein
VSAVEWENLNLAAAFLLGAVLATIAVLRIVRSLTNFFAGYRTPRPPDRHEEEDDEPTHP